MNEQQRSAAPSDVLSVGGVDTCPFERASAEVTEPRSYVIIETEANAAGRCDSVAGLLQQRTEGR